MSRGSAAGVILDVWNCPVCCALRDIAGAGACITTTFERDGRALTAKVTNEANLTGTIDATGCDIGVYYARGATGAVNLATFPVAPAHSRARS